MKCPRGFGPFTRCGVALEITTVDGRLVEFCWACDRLFRGICRDCPRRVYGVVGKARRCAACTKADANRRGRERMRQPEVRDRNMATMRAWRKANPERVKASLKAQRVRRKLRELREYRAARRAA